MKMEDFKRKYRQKQNLHLATIILILAIFALVVPGCTSTSSHLSQVATSGGGTTETQKMEATEATNFDRLVGGWKTDKDLQQYMKNFQEIPDSQSRMTIYTPDELLAAGGKGTIFEISIFAGESLVKMGYKNVQRIYFSFTPNGKPIKWIGEDHHEILVYTDKEGNNYFMWNEPPDFPIYSMGKSTDPIPFIETYLGGTVHKNLYHVENFK